MSERCWFADLPGAGPCDGRLVRVHLIPRSLLKREFGKTLGNRLAEDPRTWVRGCGGPMGNAGHNGQLDASRTVRIPRHRIPLETEEFAAEHGLGWWLDREYGARALPTPAQYRENYDPAPGHSYGPLSGQWDPSGPPSPREL